MSCGYSVAERICFIDHQFDLSRDVRGAANDRNQFVTIEPDLTFKNTADDALLSPNVALAELAIGIEACELCTRACTAWRTVVFEARTEHKIAAVGVRRVGKQLDVIDLSSVVASNVVGVEVRCLQRPKNPSGFQG